MKSYAPKRIFFKRFQNRMKLDNQVCTYEQAVKLQQLGLLQQATFYFVRTVSQKNHVNCSLFCGIEAAVKQYKAWQQHDTFLTSKTEAPVAAWNSAELGAMLPAEFVQPRHTVDLYTYKMDNAFGSGRTRYFCSLNIAELHKQQFYAEAHARAATLIYLLETEHLNIQDVNRKLQFA